MQQQPTPTSLNPDKKPTGPSINSLTCWHDGQDNLLETPTIYAEINHTDQEESWEDYWQEPIESGSITDINLVQHETQGSRTSEFQPPTFNRRRPPIDPAQLKLLERLKSYQAPSELLQEATPSLDKRLLPILANVEHTQFLI